MTKSQKTKWLESLRSGEFPQGRLQLKSESGYCCLGVLKEVCNLATESPYTLLECPEVGNIYLYMSDEIQGALAKMNDDADRRYNFKHIADWIESNVEAVDDPA